MTDSIRDLSDVDLRRAIGGMTQQQTVTSLPELESYAPVEPDDRLPETNDEVPPFEEPGRFCEMPPRLISCGMEETGGYHDGPLDGPPRALPVDPCLTSGELESARDLPVTASEPWDPLVREPESDTEQPAASDLRIPELDEWQLGATTSSGVGVRSA